MIKSFLASLLLFVLIYSCNSRKLNKGSYGGSVTTTGYNVDTLPPPNATGSAKNFSKVIGWPDGKMPTAPSGFVVTRFAGELNHPRKDGCKNRDFTRVFVRDQAR
jgi:hypothetical protein